MNSINTNQNKDNSNDVWTNNEVWDNIAKQLEENNGVATLSLPHPFPLTLQHGFSVARSAMDAISSSSKGKQEIDVPFIPENVNAACATGYHSAGCYSSSSEEEEEEKKEEGNSLSRYNEYRQGFIFSNGDLFDIPYKNNNNNESMEENDGEFQNSMEQMFQVMHNDIAIHVLEAIERRLMKQPDDDIVTQDSKENKEKWFQGQLGPTCTSSQWHVKRYVSPPTTTTMIEPTNNTIDNNNDDCSTNDKQDEEKVLLPIHTDPSLISIVIHDAPGVNEGAMGLQYQSSSSSSSPLSPSLINDKKNKIQYYEWKEVPNHGHAIATIFVGSVLTYLTGGLYPCAKHRVVAAKTTVTATRERMAATLFVRPQYNALLCVPRQSLVLRNVCMKKKNLTFGVWSERVARNYAKQQKKKKKKK